MKTLLLTTLLFAVPVAGGDRDRGLELYREGKYADAVAAFQRAAEAGDESAELQWNLALAAYRAGNLSVAEIAAEKYAALAREAKPELHKGLLGAVRHDQARQLVQQATAAVAQQQSPPTTGRDPAQQPQPEDPLPLLEQALGKAKQAKNYFVRGAAANATPELQRNTERTLRFIKELEELIEELKKQREQQDEEQQDQDEGEEQQDDEQQEQPESEEGEPEQQEEQQQEQGEGEQEPQSGENSGENKEQEGESEQQNEPQPGEGESQPEPQSQQQRPEPEQQSEQPPPPQQQQQEQPSEQRSDAPGEGAEGKELTPEQAQRLLERLQQLDKKLGEARGRIRSGRRRVERDW